MSKIAFIDADGRQVKKLRLGNHARFAKARRKVRRHFIREHLIAVDSTMALRFSLAAVERAWSRP